MKITNEIPSELQKRVEAIATRSRLSPAEIIADALENGHSLDWQEDFLAQVEKGLKSADEGDFAGDAELELVRNKYRAI